MTRLITKKMRSSFNISSGTMLGVMIAFGSKKRLTFDVKKHFEATKRQRILTLKKVVK